MVKIDTAHKLNSALIGMILFDGSMNGEKYLYIRHGGKQLNYVDEKVSFINKYLTPTSLRTSTDNKGYLYRYAYYNNERLKNLYKDIYMNGKKQLTKTILNRFDEITLAIMYMDDGCLGLHKDPNHPNTYKSREIHLNVQSFTLEEVKMLQSYLLSKWGLDFHLTYDKNNPRLWCNTKNTIKFLEIVAPIIWHNFPSMYYKLDLKYKRKKINFLPLNI
jgi:hypothetical protein